MEILLVLTLVAAAGSAGLIALLLLRERASAREAREELARGLNGFSQTLATQMSSIATVQNSQIEHIRKSVEESLARIQQDNSAKLEQMRQTVDEKLQSTLDKRLAESFKQVSERLELVHKGLGEMQTLATGVGDLKRVLTNVKTRGTWGEVQLGALLDQ
ncbi:MAG TPA: DNA recombination protein RmuC, partial [Burkholderiales bacterium]